MNKYQEALDFLKNEAFENFRNKHVQTFAGKREIVKSCLCLQELIAKVAQKKPDYWSDSIETDDRSASFNHWDCPCCGHSYELDYEEYDYCPNCGQALDWSTDDE